jgi:hypothetical protein
MKRGDRRFKFVFSPLHFIFFPFFFPPKKALRNIMTVDTLEAVDDRPVTARGPSTSTTAADRPKTARSESSFAADRPTPGEE